MLDIVTKERVLRLTNDPNFSEQIAEEITQTEIMNDMKQELYASCSLNQETLADKWEFFLISIPVKHAKLITKMSCRAMARKLKVSANILALAKLFSVSRQLRSYKVSLAVQNTVKAFFLREDISRPLPDKR